MKFGKFFALVVASSALLASSVSAGSVRGVSREDEIVEATPRRYLKDNKNNNFNPSFPANVVVAPVPPPAPVAPPTPRGVDEWASRCTTGSFNSCLNAAFASFEGCTQCLYAQSQLSSTSSTGIFSCGKFLCGGCKDEAAAFYRCGARITDPVPAPIPVPQNPSPIQAQPTPVQKPEPNTEYTFSGCPASANSGDTCNIPSGFKYQQCDYPSMNMRCVCSTLSPRFLCNEARVPATVPPPRPAPVPVPAPGTVPLPVPVPAPGTGPTPSTGGGGGGIAPGPSDGVCSTTLPKSGDTCSPGNAPWMYCCYNVDSVDGRPAPAGLALVCSCLSSERRFVCNISGTGQCSTVIRPLAPAPDPPPAPVIDPVPVPDPVPDPVEAPTSSSEAPVMELFPTTFPEVPEPEVSVPLPEVPVVPEVPGMTDPSMPNCPGSTPQNGSSCEGVVSAGMIGNCVYEQIFEDESGKPEREVDNTCRCDAANPIWVCTETVVATTPPGQSSSDMCLISTPSTGDNCGELISMFLIDYKICMFPINQAETVNCECNALGLANKAEATWNCDGATFPPASAPSMAMIPAGETQPVSLMPAGQTQPVSMVPVPSSNEPVEIVCPANAVRPSTGDDCQGFLPEAMMTEATCNYEETRMDTADGVVTSTFFTSECTCKRETNVWDCVELSSQVLDQDPVPEVEPAAPVPEIDPVPQPVDPVPEPVPLGDPEFNEFTCRPLGDGCSAPHTVPAKCDDTDACCPGNIIDDWRTGSSTCKHN